MIPWFVMAEAAAADIVVTGTLAPRNRDDVPASVTSFDTERIAGIGFPAVTDLARLVPGVSVATSGGAGAQAQIRIRGAEANHTLLFVDGIALNDPASGNEARFETLLADSFGRLEVVRGPQSALWGSEAIGGVVALDARDSGRSVEALAEAGSGRTRFALGASGGGVVLSGAAVRDRGIDVLGGGKGDRDGARQATFGVKAVEAVGSGEFGVAARYIHAETAFDGTDPVIFRRADTSDHTRSDLAAARSWARAGPFQIDGQYLASVARDYDGIAPLTRRRGDRFRMGGQADFTFGAHRLIGRLEREEETFAALDRRYAGAADQRRTRGRTAAVAELSSRFGSRFETDFALRRDAFNRFADATTMRAGAVWRPFPRVRMHVSYGEGIAQPTFYDLYGFFPGGFVGNPALRPERARSSEVGVGWRSTWLDLDIAAFTGRLRDEIVPVFDATTFLSSTANADRASRRRGIEIMAVWRPSPQWRVDANYSLLDADEPSSGGGRPVRETRRPRHSANLILAWQRGSMRIGATLAYVGARSDLDFDQVPAARVRLHPYALASFKAERRIGEGLSAFLRAENVGNAHYTDVVGYRTEGRRMFGGLRWSMGE